MAPPAPGRLTTTILVPSCFDIPSASRRAVTSADEPAGNSTVISIAPFFGKGVSCAEAIPAVLINAAQPNDRIVLMSSSRSIVRHYFRNFNAAPLTRGQDAGTNHRERSRCVFATSPRPPAVTNRRRELREFFGNRIVAGGRDIDRSLLAALEHPQSPMHVIKGGCLLAVDIHQIVFGCGGIASIECEERAILNASYASASEYY